MEQAKKKTSFKKILRVLRVLWGVSKPFVAVSLAYSLLTSFLPYVAIYCSYRIIDGLVAKAPQSQIMAYVWWMIGLGAFLGIAIAFLSRWRESMRGQIEILMARKIADKTFSLSYSQVEDHDTMRLVEMAIEGSNGSGDITSFMFWVGDFIGGATNIVYSGVLLSGLFLTSGVAHADRLVGFLDGVIGPLILLAVVVAFAVVDLLLAKSENKLSYKAMIGNIEANRRFGYFYNLCRDYQYAKDIRIYRMQRMIMKNQRDPKNSVNATWDRYSWQSLSIDCAVAFLGAVLAFVSYSFVGLKAIYGLTSVGEVVSYVGAITLLSSGLNAMVRSLAEQSLCANYLDNYFIYLNLKPASAYGKAELSGSGPLKIEFRDVSFAYPGQKEKTLDGVNLAIAPGEKLAIVGANGAGKTTLMKLLCRFYEPDSGQILIDDRPIGEFSRESCYHLFSIVFQDFKLFSYSIRENVYCGASGDEEKATACLKKAGIYDKILTFPKKIDTIIYQKNDEDGVEISGGEAQKIAIARALYKDSPIVILDEPTSALDPKSEAEIYEKFSLLVKGKTAVFISHRMSSTKFCDRIAVFDGGRIVELGSHKALLAKADGLYRKMWDAQAQYYS